MELNKTILPILTILLTIILLLSSIFIRIDDAFIFYTYAKNIAEGAGYVFNNGEKINATTSFIYTLLLAIIYIPFKPNHEALIFIGNLISIFSLLLASIILSKIFSHYLKETKSLLPLIVLSIPLIKSSIGMETCFKLMLISLTLYFYEKEKFILTSIFAGILVLTRPDTIILILLLIINFSFKFKKLPEFKTVIPFLVIVLSYLFFSLLYFGNIMPTSLSVKISQQKFNIIDGNFIDGFVTNFPGGETLAVAFYSLIFIGILILIFSSESIFKHQIFKILSIYFVIHILIYHFIINPPPYPWYYSDYIIFYSLIIGNLIQKFFDYFVKARNEMILIFTALFIFSIGLIFPLRTIKNGYNEKYLVYKNTASFLNSLSYNQTKLATDEIGIFGFYYNGKIIDELGLITPIAIEGIKQNDFSYVIEKTQPEFVVVDYPSYPHYKSYINEDWFRRDYFKFYILKYPNTGICVFKRKNF